ncbi:MAG: hypothetical protein P4M13_00970 [Alphaproteobacteria bacterium]|nr:hypothetical protein [Alphaproteobacteria bacterium]
MRKISSLLLATTLCVSTATFPAFAQDWHDHDRHGHHGEWHGDRGGRDWRWHGDIHHFHDYDFDYWRAGRWINGYHEGRAGWWWVTGGFWYYYPAPIYPYPDPFTPPGVVVAAVPGATASYFYCANPAGYYPYVPQCAVQWQHVVTATAPAQVVVPPQVASPPAPVAAPAPPPAPVATSQRDADYAQLNAYAAELQHIDASNPHVALVKLKKLGKKVEAFRKNLTKREYNPIDILKSANDLKIRIAAQKKSLVSPAAPLPPGSTVVFPSH